MSAKAPPPAADRATPATDALLHDVIDALGGSSAVDGDATVRVRTVLDAAVRAERARAESLYRLAAMGRRLAGTAHELRNPLSVIETSAFVLAESGGDPERLARHTRRIAEQVRLANGIVGDLLDAARGRTTELEDVDVGAALRAAVSQLRAENAGKVHVTIAETLPPARAVARRVQQIAVNLLTNALEATRGAGRIEADVAVDGDSLKLAVSDDGPGIAAEHLARLFEPLFTTRDDGHGLGLWLSRETARAMGGELTGGNNATGGARFELTLPRARTPRGAV